MYNYDEQYGIEFVDLTLSENLDYKWDNLLDDPLALFLQEIEIAIKTQPNEVWGVYENININRYVFNKFITVNQVKTELQTFIKNNCIQANNFVWDVTPQFVIIDNKKMLYILININRNEDETVTTKFLIG